jgi:CheY-like chemotaxis protein
VLDPSKSPRALEIARHESDQLARLVDDLLDVTRMTQGRITLRKQHVAFDAVVQRAVDSMRPLFEERAVGLTVSLPAHHVEVEGDAVRLEQVVGNLLTNAAKYTETGGRVSVTLEHAEGCAVLRVADTGIGISAELLPKIFELFVQAEQTLDRTRGGLGIGLTLVKQLVEMHGGSVEAHSEGVGRGAELTVRLPARIPVENAAAKLLERPRPAAGTRVLIVEDNADAAESLVMLLELLGLRARSAADGFAALETARSNPPDVMLIDIGLPGMSGYELAERIRQDETLRGVVLVALTGYGQEEDRQRAFAAGFDYHLVKPVDIEKVERVVAGITPSRTSVH